jgi:hypothetical protein
MKATAATLLQLCERFPRSVVAVVPGSTPSLWGEVD